jgi:hypothetical protein
MEKTDKTITDPGAGDIPAHKWTRRLSEPDPDPQVHTFSRPPILEALSLLPVAARVGRSFLSLLISFILLLLSLRYIWEERRMKREPIFDLNGVMLEPPKPGPYGGCPLGGIGGGCIGRGTSPDLFLKKWLLIVDFKDTVEIFAAGLCMQASTATRSSTRISSVSESSLPKEFIQRQLLSFSLIPLPESLPSPLPSGALCVRWEGCRWSCFVGLVSFLFPSFFMSHQSIFLCFCHLQGRPSRESGLSRSFPSRLDRHHGACPRNQSHNLATLPRLPPQV